MYWSLSWKSSAVFYPYVCKYKSMKHRATITVMQSQSISFAVLIVRCFLFTSDDYFTLLKLHILSQYEHLWKKKKRKVCNMLGDVCLVTEINSWYTASIFPIILLLSWNHVYTWHSILIANAWKCNMKVWPWTGLTTERSMILTDHPKHVSAPLTTENMFTVV